MSAPRWKGRVDAVARRVRPHPRQRHPRRLLHHLAEPAGQGQRARAGHPADFDEQDAAAGHRAEGQPHGDARPAGAGGDLRLAMRRRPQHPGEGLRRDLDRRFVSLGPTAHQLGADRRERIGQIPHPRSHGCGRRSWLPLLRR